MEFEEVEQTQADTDLGVAYTRYIFYVTIPVPVLYVAIRTLLAG